MKVLFLDVDGVITVADGTGRLCEDKLERLQRVVLQTQSTIVISSNWRLFPQLKTRLVMALHEHGGMRVAGCTPDHGERVHGDAVSLPFPPMPSVGVAPLPTLPFPRRGRGGEQQNQPRHACGSTQIIMLVPTSPPPPGAGPTGGDCRLDQGVAGRAHRGLVRRRRPAAADGARRRGARRALCGGGRDARADRARGGADPGRPAHGA